MMVLQQWTGAQEQERGITITSAATTCDGISLLKVKYYLKRYLSIYYYRYSGTR
jgi:hypothetical protein